jgi:alpha-L-rhamnosidase
MKRVCSIAAVLAVNTGMIAGGEAPTGLMCELLAAPEISRIADARPEFGWIVRSVKPGDLQSAYRIVVRSAGGEEVWDSGKVESADSINVAYGGEDLVPDSEYSWKVKAWTRLADESDWSKPQTFRTAAKLEGYATSRYPLVETPVAPVAIERKGDGHYLVDFGRVAFGHLALKLDAPAAGELEIHLA